eukprot:8265324-Ditylum_brightwellii.AAC.1
MIGVHTPFNQQPSAEWTYLKKKTMKFVKALEVCPAKLHEARTLYTTMLLPSIRYPLPATSLDNDQFEHLEKLFMPTLLQNMSKGYPRVLIYCNKKCLGSDFFHIQSLHISARTTYLIKHLCHQSYIDNTARAMII